MYISRKYLVALCLFIICVNKQVKAGDTLTSMNVETVSLKLFNDKNWKELIPFCDKAIKQGFDYYYLRMRGGIACYETKKYRKAEAHFKKALSFNTGDDDATSYLYYCLIYNEKYEEAKWLSKSFNDAMAEKLGTKKAFPISFINLEGAEKLSSRTDSIGNALYYQVAVEHYLFKRVSLFHSFSFNGQTDYDNPTIHDSVVVPLMPLVHGQPPPDSTIRFTNTTKRTTIIQQYHYYLKANVPFKNNFLLSMSGQWIYEKDKLTANGYTQNYIKPTTLGPPPNGGGPPDTLYAHKVTNNVPGQDVSTSLSNFILSASLKKYTTYVDYSIGALADIIANHNEYQVSGAVELHPLANNNLNIGCIGYLHWHQPFSQTSAVAFSPFLSFTPVKHLTVTADYMQNAQGNVVEYSGYYVNNTPFFIKNRYSVGVNYKIGKKVSVYANYGLENRGSRFSNFTFTNNLCLIGIAITP